MCLAIPGKVEEITTDSLIRMGRINFDGVVKRVCLDYVPEIRVGDYALVHVGFALSVIDEQTARETLEAFRTMGVLQEELATEDEVFARAALARSLHTPAAVAPPSRSRPELQPTRNQASPRVAGTATADDQRVTPDSGDVREPTDPLTSSFKSP
jgi:hydrogenase expression/formation protein HypC